MMAGNWGQHAFVDQETPENNYRNSLTCINSRYNKQAFNDGYHIGHHLRPGMHWTEMSVDFKANIEEYAKEKGINTVIEYGEAAFYGPKLDFMVKDALGRNWQLGTIQVDYNLPDRFELEYVGSDNQTHRPVMIHRAPFGSMERFVSVLLEHCAGNFPLWLTPTQVMILPISEKYHDYSQKVLNLLNNSDIRGLVDQRAEKAGRKIRDAEISKTPYMLIVGEKEKSENTVTIRKHGGGDLGSMKIENFILLIEKQISELTGNN